MSYHTFNQSADKRTGQALASIALQNSYLEYAPDGAPKPTKITRKTWPGMVKRATGASFCRGVYSQKGVVGGALFGVFGGGLYVVSSAYGLTLIGSVVGAKPVRWAFLRQKLLVLADGTLYQWDGTTFTTVTDVDFPAGATTLAVIDQRVVVSSEDSDVYYWSDVLDATSWPAANFATSERRPDPIIGSGVLAGDLWFFSATSSEPLRGGGVVSLPFQTLRSTDISRGCIARDSIVLINSSFYFIGDDLVVYKTQGYGWAAISNLDVETRIKALAQPQTIQGFSFQIGSKFFYVLWLPEGNAWALDLQNNTWLELSYRGEDAYRGAFSASAYGKTFVAGPNSANLYTYELGVYANDDTPLEALWSVSLPLSERMSIDSLALDLECFDQPLSGQGSDPILGVRIYKDGGRLEGSSYIERQVKLGKRGKTAKLPVLWKLGQGDPKNGLILEFSFAEPCGVNFTGLRVNEGLP